MFGEKKISRLLKEFCSSLCRATLARLSASLLGIGFSLRQSLFYEKERVRNERECSSFYFVLEVVGEQNVIAAPTSATSVTGLSAFLLLVPPPSPTVFASSYLER